jgi:hypothetical protein
MTSKQKYLLTRVRHGYDHCAKGSKENENAIVSLGWAGVGSASGEYATRAIAFLGGVTGFHGGILGLEAQGQK